MNIEVITFGGIPSSDNFMNSFPINAPIASDIYLFGTVITFISLNDSDLKFIVVGVLGGSIA